MPIDSSPEGGEIRHVPIVKPFPVNAPADDKDDEHEDELKQNESANRPAIFLDDLTGVKPASRE